VRRATCDWLVAELTELDPDLRVDSYHAGIDQGRKSRVQMEWSDGELDCVVATVAFGMGIDRADVRCGRHRLQCIQGRRGLQCIMAGRASSASTTGMASSASMADMASIASLAGVAPSASMGRLAGSGSTTAGVFAASGVT
jgi:hypothetical protein